MADLIDITLDRLPSWLLGPWGESWHVVTGAVKEALAQASREATKARFPSVAPTDALPQLAANRAMSRGHNESLATFRARIRQAWAIWLLCGTRAGLTRAIDALYPEYPASCTITEYWDGGFTVDDTRWARFRLEVTLPHWGDAPLWDAFHWDDGSHWDITAPEAEIRALRATIHQWTPAYALCERVRIHGAGGVVVDLPNP